MRFSHAFGLALAAALALAACGGNNGGGGDDDDAGTGDDDGGTGPCQNLECFQVECSGGGTSSVSGRVFAPNGTLPLYNVTVYVPNGTVADFDEGAQCDRCGTVLSGDPLVETLTDTEGRFTLEDMPVTSDVPLVIQVGKWRRKITIPAVGECVDTPLDEATTRFPRVQGESDPADHIPLMALTTGGADALECLLRKIGIDDSEFGVAGGAGRVHLYAGNASSSGGGTDQYDDALGGEQFAAATELWDSVDDLSVYDVVFLSCEGDQNPGDKTSGMRDALEAYADLGGRVFMSHWHNYWLQEVDPWNTVATVNPQDDLGEVTANVNQGFDRGEALADWLVNVGASDTLGEIDLVDTKNTVTDLDEGQADKWIFLDDTANGVPAYLYLSFLTPLDAEDKCGRAVFSDIHVSTGDESEASFTFPTDGCTTDITELTPQEKVLAFMIFDIASCVGPIVE